jgi:hypothetical protein
MVEPDNLLVFKESRERFQHQTHIIFSPISQIVMNLNVVFPIDRFYLVKTWKHDNSCVYRFATATGELAVTTNLLANDCKANTIFLKVQNPSYPECYDLLKKEGITLPSEARYGLPNTISSMMKQQFTPLNCVVGQKFTNLYNKYAGHIERSKMESGCLRIFTIVWAPNREPVRTRDMRGFIDANYANQIWLSKVDKAAKTPVRAVLNFFHLGGSPDTNSDFVGSGGGSRGGDYE